jgi:formylglycine-generating enzyme
LIATLLFFVMPQVQPPPNMAEIPAGEFWMGRIRMYRPDENRYFLRLRIDDVPSHLVQIDRFFIDKYEVTHEDYAKFVEATKHRVPFHWKNGKVPEGHGQYPVYNVSWDDAADYCKWAGKRLPTEAEWEKAARGGLEKKVYPWGDDLWPGGKKGQPAADAAADDANAANAANKPSTPPAPKLALYNGISGPTKVGSYPPNGYGLYDVIGNVAEWVNDWYERTYYTTSPDANPPGPESGMYRVVRGNSWGDVVEVGDNVEPRVYGVHWRNFQVPFHRTNTVGFRCAKTP